MKKIVDHITDNRFIGILILSGLIVPIFIFFFDQTDTAGQLGSYLAGTTGVLWGLASIIFIYKAFIGSQVQQVENIFFSMLNMLNEIMKNTEGEIMFREEEINFKPFRGLQFYSKFHAHLKQEVWQAQEYKDWFWEGTKQKAFSNHPAGDGRVTPKTEFNIYVYELIFSQYIPQLGHFYRYLFNIITFIDENEVLNDPHKIRLLNLIQAQLSNEVLGLVFYNALTDVGAKLKVLLAKYPFLLENIDPQSILSNRDIEAYEGLITFKHIRADD